MSRTLVVGYGAIGARHVRVLEALGHAVAVVSRRPGHVAHLYPTLGDGVSAWRPDYVVIASRTGEHLTDFTTLAQLGFGGRVLIEKPLFAAPTGLPAHRFAVARVGYNLRFHPVVRRLRELLSDATPRAVELHVGQHLSEWRPGTDHRGSYSAQAGEGGVLRDLSHELDLACWLFGRWRKTTAILGRGGALDIGSEDTASLLLATKRCEQVSVTLNYLDRPARRSIHVATDEGTVSADLIGGTVSVNGNVERYTAERDTTYIAQHREMLERDGGEACTLEEGLAVTALCAAAERAAADEIWVTR